MTKPTENLDWATNGTAQEIVEPTTGMRTEGIKSGGSWYRENLNWMFNGLGKWIDYLRDDVLDKDNNLSELVDKTASFDNIKQGATGSYAGVVEKAIQTEMIAGTIGKFPDCKEVKDLVDSRFSALGTLSTQDAGTNAAQFRDNSQNEFEYAPIPNPTSYHIGVMKRGSLVFAALDNTAGDTNRVEFGHRQLMNGGYRLRPSTATGAAYADDYIVEGWYTCLGFSPAATGSNIASATLWQRTT